MRSHLWKDLEALWYPHCEEREEREGRGEESREGRGEKGGEGREGRGSIKSTPTDRVCANILSLVIVNGNILHLGGVREEVDHCIQQRLDALVLEGRPHQDWCEAATDGGSTNSSLPRVT